MVSTPASSSTWTVTGVAVDASSAKRGPGSGLPWWCSMRTRTTSGMGELYVTVASGRLRVSPRRVIRVVGA